MLRIGIFSIEKLQNCFHRNRQNPYISVTWFNRKKHKVIENKFTFLKKFFKFCLKYNELDTLIFIFNILWYQTTKICPGVTDCI